MSRLPKDCSSRRIGSKARQMVHGAFDVANWEFHEITGVDTGFDCEVQLVLNDEFTGKKIIGQIKGKLNLNILKNGLISFPLETKTIRYGINQPSPFVLFLADVAKDVVYYLPIQDYLIENPSVFDKLKSDSQTINVHISPERVVTEDDSDLVAIAQKVYLGDMNEGIRCIN